MESITTSDPISDHCAVFAQLYLDQPLDTPLRKLYLPDYQRADWPALRSTLHDIPLFEAIQDTNDIDVAWQVWRGLAWSAVLKHVPFRTLTLRPKNKLWMNSYLHRLSRRKLRLFRAAKRHQTPDAWHTYKTFRNFCNSEFARAKKLHTARQQDTLHEEINGSRTWWTKAKHLSRITAPHESIPTLKCPQTDNVAHTSSAKSELLANFFAKQCTSPTPTQDSSSNAPYPLAEEHPTFEFPPIEELTVLRCLRRLSPSKSSGCTVLSNRVLREVAAEICHSLTYLYNLSIKTCTFPREWKTAIVTPIYKNRGRADNPSNYRPISLLPAVGKVLDKIQSQALCQYLMEKNIITEHQFGFLPGRSTTHQLLHVTELWLQAHSKRERVLAAFMDFQKAFDKVWHPGLLFKLGNCGLQPHAIRWLGNYLTDRKLIVSVDGTLSNPQAISAGVPQGSHLGPILFTVFINDLPSSVTTPSELYADDALLHQILTREHPDSDTAILQESLSLAAAWATTWKGRFSPEKTTLMHIHNDHQLAELPTLLLEGKQLDLVSQHKHLGLTFQENLAWSAHLDKVISKGTQRAGLLKLMARTLAPEIITKLYLYYVRPVLEYASPVWHSAAPSSAAAALERIQASVARTIINADWMTPKDDLLKELNWPSLRWRREITGMTLFHTLQAKKKQNYSSILNHHIPQHLYELTNRSRRKPLDVRLPHVRTSRQTKSFFFRSALLWNSLPHTLQSIESTHSFQQNLELHWHKYKHNTQSDVPLPPI